MSWKRVVWQEVDFCLFSRLYFPSPSPFSILINTGGQYIVFEFLHSTLPPASASPVAQVHQHSQLEQVSSPATLSTFLVVCGKVSKGRTPVNFYHVPSNLRASFSDPWGGKLLPASLVFLLAVKVCRNCWREGVGVNGLLNMEEMTQESSFINACFQFVPTSVVLPPVEDQKGRRHKLADSGV